MKTKAQNADASFPYTVLEHKLNVYTFNVQTQHHFYSICSAFITSGREVWKQAGKAGETGMIVKVGSFSGNGSTTK
ncbi:hypothetical protein [Pontibacter diazotrophicus]|uniref:hypothetical protein n=1 Tax=Pontibacter diazotrophicus TaxID=1400979 RepID=UPI0011C0175D|nr:hypothetical protein [Pontibacter diazotrophicus]